jgi:hypothetical protein
MKLSRVGVDLAKNVYQLHGVDRHGKAVWKRRLRRGPFAKRVTDRNSCSDTLVNLFHQFVGVDWLGEKTGALEIVHDNCI